MCVQCFTSETEDENVKSTLVVYTYYNEVNAFF